MEAVAANITEAQIETLDPPLPPPQEILESSYYHQNQPQPPPPHSETLIPDQNPCNDFPQNTLDDNNNSSFPTDIHNKPLLSENGGLTNNTHSSSRLSHLTFLSFFFFFLFFRLFFAFSVWFWTVESWFFFFLDWHGSWALLWASQMMG